MKALLVAVAVIVLMIGTPLVFAETAYQSGFKHGVADGKLDNIIYCLNAPPGCHLPPDKTYIHQPGNGFDHHTTQFVNGYIKGWCSIIGPHGGGGIDGNDDGYNAAISDCDIGLSSAFPRPMDWPAK